MYKKEITPEKLTYYYQPEGEGLKGEIGYNIETDDIEMLKEAENDISNSGFYTAHCLRAFREFVKNNDFPETHMRAWY
jgi:hypothetical protein